MVHIWGVLGSISGPHCRVNKWSTSFRSMKIGVSEDLLSQVFRGVCRVFIFCVGPKTGFKKVAKIGFLIVLFWCLLLHVTAR